MPHPCHDADGRPAAPTGHLSLRGMCADFARREAAQAARARALGLTRREFFEMLAAGAAAAGAVAVGPDRAAGADAASAAPAAPAAPAAAPRARVVVVTHPEVLLKDYRANPAVVRQMLDRAVADLTGKRNEAQAWASLGRENDFVAIKYNTMGRPTLSSHTEINDVVASQLIANARVKGDRILAVDRDLPPPYNELSDPFTLPSRNLQTRLRRLYTDQATAIVNVSVLKTHFTDGMSTCLKNHLGSVNNPAAFHGWEPDRMPRSLPELNALEPIRSKTRLVIIDAIRPLFAGGPGDNPENRWDYRGLIVSTDPVAASAVGLRILEEKRAASRGGKEWPLTAARLMLAHAQAIGLGAADADRIDVVQATLG